MRTPSKTTKNRKQGTKCKITTIIYYSYARYKKSIHGAMDRFMGLVIMNKYGTMDTIMLTNKITV